MSDVPWNLAPSSIEKAGACTSPMGIPVLSNCSRSVARTVALTFRC